MSPQPSGPSYDPLPLTNEQAHTDTLYNTPPSPGLTSPFDDSTPLPAAQPRFIGPALYSEGGPSIRDSYASSHNTFPSDGRASEYSSSVYALNDAHGATSGAHYHDDPHDFSSDRDMNMSPLGQGNNRYLNEKRAAYVPPKSRRKVMIFAIVAAIALLIIAVVIPVYFAVVKPNQNKANNDAATSGSEPSASSGSGSSGGDSGTKSNLAVTGGDGSTVTMQDGTTFTYSNSFGGTWYWDENDPFNEGARAQSWTSALNESFNYGVEQIRGVNIGGWLVPEPFMQVAPYLYEPFVNNTTPAIDEWTLCENMAATSEGLATLENHYKTFITEKDFAEIAGAGLNYVRISLGFWAIETRPGEPFLANVSWQYFLKAIQWARKYGLRINLDYHALPGSQNGWNHSGKLGDINMLVGPMGLANAQRALDHIRILSEFISQPQYKNVVTMFGITNEPRAQFMGQQALSSYYLQAYEFVRRAGGIGEGNGPFISFSDAFMLRNNWAGFLPNADRIALDSHPYLCFGPQSNAAMGTYATAPCDWGSDVNTSMSAFGLSLAGEFSNAVTDCGLWVNGVGQGTRYDGTYTVDTTFDRVGSCTPWTDWQNWDQTMKDSVKNFALASMDSLQNYFFWTWKIANSSVTGKVEAPSWSYQLGLQNGWMPKDPREAAGVCGNTSPWTPPLKPYQTGGAGAGNIDAAVSASYPWPPASINSGGAASLLPTYTPTGPIPTLPGPTFTQSGATATATPSVGNGWVNPSDNAGLMVAISSCSYLDPWVGTAAAPPSPLCSGATTKRKEPVLELREPVITPAPFAR